MQKPQQQNVNLNPLQLMTMGLYKVPEFGL